MSFKNQSVFSSTYTNTTFTVTEGMGISSITINLVSGSATLLGGLGIPGLTNSSVALTAGQPVVLNVSNGYTLEGVTVDSTAGGVFQVFTIYNYIDELDPSAAAYLAATGITGAVQSAAIDTLVRGLKVDGLWSKMKAVYPFVTDNRNLLGYTEDFGNAYWNKMQTTITANATTAPNGTLTADTLTDNATNNFHGISTFQTAFGQNGNNTLSIYAKANSLNYIILYFYNGSEPAGKSAWFNLSNGTIGTVQSGITANIENAGNGWYRCSITRNFNFTATFSNCGYGVANADNVVAYLGSNQSIYIWGAQVDAAATATTYQPIATTQQAFISSQFKYNLVNPVDSDAAFRLVFNGGWTHSSTGATPNGTNAVANTYFNPSLHNISNSSHISYYSRTLFVDTNGVAEIGCLSSGGAQRNLINASFSGTTYCLPNNNSETVVNFASNGVGFYLASRTSATAIIGQRNSTQFTGSATTTRLNQVVGIGAAGFSGGWAFYSPRQAAFSSIGDGLTNTEAANLYTRVQAFQNSLNRAVI